MKATRQIGLTLVCFLCACGVAAEELGGDRYRIPPENLLMNTFAGEYVRFAYGGTVPEGQNDVGLVFKGQEVAAAIPGFKSRTQGYVGLVDASPSVVVSLSAGSNFREMLAQNVARLDPSQEFVRFGDSEFYRPNADDSMFQLAAENGTWSRDDMLPPNCRTAQTREGGTYHSCAFRLRREGFEFGFSLSGENIGFADKFADFVREKLESWKVSEVN